MYAPPDYIEVEISQEKSKCKIKRNGKYNENFMSSSDYKNFCFSCITEACKNY